MNVITSTNCQKIKKTEKNEKRIKKEVTKPPELTNNKLYDKYKL